MRLPLQCIRGMCSSWCAGDQPLNCGVQRQTRTERCPPPRRAWAAAGLARTYKQVSLPGGAPRYRGFAPKSHPRSRMGRSDTLANAFDSSMRLVLGFIAGDRSAYASIQQVLAKLQGQRQEELQQLLASEWHVLT